MNDTTNSTAQMPIVPDADGYDQCFDDDRDETLLMHKDAELEAESTVDGNRMRREPSAQVHPANGDGSHLAECN